MNIIDLFSPAAGQRLQAATASGPFKTSEAFAQVARDIAGDPGETGMTLDHIAAVIMLVTFESDGNLQAATVMVAALDEILRAAKFMSKQEPFVLEFEADVDNLGEPGEKDRWRIVVEGSTIQVERWEDPDAMGTKHWKSFRGDGWNDAAVLRYAVTALVRGAEGAREVAARSFVDTSIPKTEAEAETEAYILAEDLRASDVLIHDGRTNIDLVDAWNDRFRRAGRAVRYWPDGRGKGWGIVTTNVGPACFIGDAAKVIVGFRDGITGERDPAGGLLVPLDLVTGIGQCAECLAHDMLFYFPATNEEGWRCTACGWKPGEPPGYDPFLDRHLIDTKVGGFVHDLADRDLLGVSNGSHGDGITGGVANHCREVGRYDQATILAAIFGGCQSHGTFWAKISDAIVAGKDERKRCSGGNLVVCYSWRDGEEHSTCLDKDCECDR